MDKGNLYITGSDLCKSRLRERHPTHKHTLLPYHLFYTFTQDVMRRSGQGRGDGRSGAAAAARGPTAQGGGGGGAGTAVRLSSLLDDVTAG